VGRFVAVAWVLLGAAGCGDPSAVPPTPPPLDGGLPCGTGPGMVVPGTGTARFEPLPATGGELEIVRGAQGGIHVLVGFRPIDTELTVSVVYSLHELGRETEIALPVSRALNPGGFTRDATGYVRLNDLLVLDNMTPRVEDFVGRSGTLRVELASVDGTHACPEVDVTLVDRI